MINHQTNSYQTTGLLLLAGLLISACDGANVPGPAEMNERYEAVLEATQPPVSANFVPNGIEERTALARVEQYFLTMSGESVRTDTASVYAPTGVLYDNFDVIEGVDGIRDYFELSVSKSDELKVEFLQTSRTGVDYFVRWRMTIRSDALNDGEPMVSYGVSQFRFDNEGRLLMHRDFWDASTGFFEYLPGLAGLLQSVKAKLIEH
ncbi:MAG: nuclear transport factor 2 family protein [Gammaproteobacteria bacterium]